VWAVVGLFIGWRIGTKLAVVLSSILFDQDVDLDKTLLSLWLVYAFAVFGGKA